MSAGPDVPFGLMDRRVFLTWPTRGRPRCTFQDVPTSVSARALPAFTSPRSSHASTPLPLDPMGVICLGPPAPWAMQLSGLGPMAQPTSRLRPRADPTMCRSPDMAQTKTDSQEDRTAWDRVAPPLDSTACLSWRTSLAGGEEEICCRSWKGPQMITLLEARQMLWRDLSTIQCEVTFTVIFPHLTHQHIPLQLLIRGSPSSLGSR